MKIIIKFLNVFGVDIIKMFNAFYGLPTFIVNYFKFKKTLRHSPGYRFELHLKNVYPCLWDRFDNSGVAKGHYFHQDLLVAQWIYEKQPKKHVDVGSRIDGFVAHVASFMPIEVFDIRPLTSRSHNITFTQMDITKLPKKYINYTTSLSCLHALEHIGLGRYGDTLDPSGYIKGFKNLVKMLKKNGVLYFSVPIGYQRIEFDAHRVFAIKTLIDMFKEYNLTVEQFAYIDDLGDLHDTANIRDGLKDNFGCCYGCGIFVLKK